MSLQQLHFVVSAPRSGSTWLCQALNQHPGIFATEHRLFGEFCEVWNNNDGSTSPRITFDAYAKAFAGFYFHEDLGLSREQFLNHFQLGFANFLTSFALRRCDANMVVDKITPYHGRSSIVLNHLEKSLPESKVIRLIRDGRDVVTSGAFDWIAKDAVGTPRYEYFVGNARTTLDRFFDDQVLAKWADHWAETIVTFSGKSDLEVRYESMLDSLSQELLRVYECLGVDVDETLSRNAETATSFKEKTGRDSGEMVATAKARKGIAGDWENWFTKRDGQVFVEAAGDALIEAGYVTDHSWVENLPEKLSVGKEKASGEDAASGEGTPKAS